MTWTSFSILNFDRPFWEVENICMSFKTRLRYDLKCSILYQCMRSKNIIIIQGLGDEYDLNNDLVRLIYYCLFTYLSRWGWFLIARAIYQKKWMATSCEIIYNPSVIPYITYTNIIYGLSLVTTNCFITNVNCICIWNSTECDKRA